MRFSSSTGEKSVVYIWDKFEGKVATMSSVAVAVAEALAKPTRSTPIRGTAPKEHCNVEVLQSNFLLQVQCLSVVVSL